MYRLIAFKKMKRVIFKTSEAVANHGGAMETDTISKHGASPKSQMSGENLLFKPVLIIVIVIVLLSSCNTPKIFTSPDAKTLAEKHQKVAIIPSTVSITAKGNVSAEAMQEQQKTESLNFQKEIYSWILKRKMKGLITVDIQDIETTNALLSRAGYPETLLTTAEFCKTLGVDGIIISHFSMSKPKSEGAAIATAVLLGGSGGKTNQVQTKISINECENQKLIWNYEHKLSGGLGSSPAMIVEKLMKKASKKMPYYSK